MRSTLINEISATRFWSMLICASTRRCRSFAAWYSAFSRRSPSSRARLISFGSSSFSSWFSVWISSSNFLISRSFIVSPRVGAIVPQCYPSRVTITSRQNPVVARFRTAARGDVGGVILLDGAHLVGDALAAQVTFQIAAVTTASSDDAGIAPLLEALGRNGVEVVTVSAPVMDALSPVKTPSGIVALAERPAGDPDRLYGGASALVVAAVDVQDPGNLGAIVRVAEAAGASGLMAAGVSANPFGWKALRGSMGSALRLPIASEITAEEAIADARRHGCRIIATAPRDGRSI